MDVAELAGALRPALPDLLIALDFDGTLAPIVPDPEDSRPVGGTAEALAGLARRGARIAVITGRDARTVVRLGGFDAVPGVVVAGLYGIERWTDGELTSPETPPTLHALAERLPAVLAGAGADPDVWIEDKRLSLVVHGRKAADPAGALAPLRAPVERLAAELELEVHPGNGVLEIRLPGFDKAGALRRLTDEGDYRGVLFAGDDLGDVPAFEEIRRLRDGGIRAYGVAVRSSGVTEAIKSADLGVSTADDLLDLLRRI